MSNQSSDQAVKHGNSNHMSPLIVPLQINGHEVESKTVFDVVNPESGKTVWQSASASKNDGIQAIEAAEAAFQYWSKTKPSTRRDIFIKAADIFARREDELVEYMVLQTGAQERAARTNVTLSVEQLRDVAGRIAVVSGHLPSCSDQGKSAMVIKEPYGVVFGIAAWNAPYILGFRAVSYALAAGNTTVLKGSELSPRCTWAIGSVFKEAGLPDGCLNIIHCKPENAAEVTTAIIEHPAVKKINFTGSTNVGRIIGAIAGKSLKPVLMELGGKASAIVLKDADLRLAAAQCALGAFVHGGQICMATERIIVQSPIAAAFSEALKVAISQIFPSSAPAQILVTAAGVQKNEKLITQAVSKGAKLLVGELNPEQISDTRMRPFVVEGVNRDMDLYYQESFGPTVSLFTADSEDEAIAIANDTEYGLSSAVFTSDLATGLRVAKQIESGAVHINSMTVHDEPSLPHGGSKQSGFGRFNASVGIEEFLRLKTITWLD